MLYVINKYIMPCSDRDSYSSGSPQTCDVHGWSGISSPSLSTSQALRVPLYVPGTGLNSCFSVEKSSICHPNQVIFRHCQGWVRLSVRGKPVQAQPHPTMLLQNGWSAFSHRTAVRQIRTIGWKWTSRSSVW